MRLTRKEYSICTAKKTHGFPRIKERSFVAKPKGTYSNPTGLGQNPVDSLSTFTSSTHLGFSWFMSDMLLVVPHEFT